MNRKFPMAQRLSTPLKSFRDDTSGAVSMEALLVFPMLVTGWLIAYTFFDAYQVLNSSTKATYTVADLISRQTNEIGDSDIDGMANVLRSMIPATERAELRATEIVFTVTDPLTGAGNHCVTWSHATGTQAERFTPGLAAIADLIPPMNNGERMLLVESFVRYDSGFASSLQDIDFDTFTVTRPRYDVRIPYENTPPVVTC